ncbi:MAG TPA: CoA ester lyase [Sporichthya sp.]|nr:CoA ester lyase [Sporichthya sp.]
MSEVGRVLRLRNPLFVPGGRPELLPKIARSAPDAVFVDLEDAVPPAEKETARSLVVEALTSTRPEVALAFVRINPVDSAWHDQDVAACAGLIGGGTLDGVVLPKFEHPGQLLTLRAALPPGALVVGGLETALGVADARPLCAAGPDAVYFGAEDFALDVGGRRTPGGQEVLFARSQVVLAAALAGVTALDQAVVSVRDVEAFRVDAEAGRDLGFDGKICLHPDQVAVAAQIYTPSPQEIAHAEAVIAAAATGVGVLDGAMVDAVHVRMAEMVLVRAGESG